MEFLVIAGVVGALGAVVAYAVKEARRREQTWRQVAARRGATFIPARGFLGSKPYAIEERRGDVRVLLDTYVVSTGKSSTTYTRCRSSFVFPAGPVFRVYREGFFSSIGKALGTQDVTLGALREFDEHFMVKCDEPGLTRAVLDVQTMQRLLQVLPHAKVESNGHEVTLTWTGAMSDPHGLEACLDVVGAIADSDIFGLGGLRAVPGATIATQTSVRVDVPDAVELGIGIDRSHVRTWARAQVPRDAARYRATIGADGRLDGDISVSHDATRLMAELAGGRLECEAGTVVYWFDRIEVDAERLLTGAKLVAALGRPTAGGVFR